MTDSTTTEEWKPVTDFPLYEVSNLGQIRNAETKQVKRRNWTAKRCYVNLYRGNTVSRKLVSGLVAEAFLGPKPKGYQIEHLDQDCTNNAVTNLVYVTQSVNQLRSYALTASEE